MKRTTLRSKEVNKQLERYNIKLSKKAQVELLENKEFKIILINKQPAFFCYNNELVPTLKYLQNHSNILKKITIDMGAIKFVINGADIMRPGITEIEEGIKKDDFVVIVDENNLKPLAVGIALFDAEEMKSLRAGKVVKNIHYVGDEVWRMG